MRVVEIHKNGKKTNECCQAAKTLQNSCKSGEITCFVAIGIGDDNEAIIFLGNNSGEGRKTKFEIQGLVLQMLKFGLDEVCNSFTEDEDGQG